MGKLTVLRARAVRSLIVLQFAVVAPLALNAQELIADGLQGAQGSAIGWRGNLYVTEGAAGRISRVDRRTGEVTTFHEGGLPVAVLPIGGVVDVVFVGHTAYALVTLVGEFGAGIDGIYRIDGPTSATLVADLGSFSAANPPDTAFFLTHGVYYAIEAYDGGFLVTDGHHNRVLRVSKHGRISVFRTFANIVPTGLETYDDAVFMAQAGPIPHDAEDGKIVAFWPKLPVSLDVVSGAPLLVDVEIGREEVIFGLAQGDWPHDPAIPENAGLPAAPGTGSLFKVDDDGEFEIVADKLNLPTSLEIIGNDAYIVTLAGQVLKIADVLPPLRLRHEHWHWDASH
jgi:sugar lactone lactonase YvrE